MPVPSTFLLIDLTGDGGAVEFRFPEEIESEDNADWRVQSTAGGVQPLNFASVAPCELSIQGLLLDGTDANTSVTPQIEGLRDLLRRTKAGTPSVLLAVWGDEKFNGVLVNLHVKRLFCDYGGEPLRASVDFRLREIQGMTRPRRANNVRPRRVN
jgi:hypothetical protein